MRAEIVPVEMAVEFDNLSAEDGENSEARLMPALTPSSGEEARVVINPMQGLAIIYGLDRRIPDLNDSAHDMVTWTIGNVKLVFSTDEWLALIERTNQVVRAGRKNWIAAFGEAKTA